MKSLLRDRRAALLEMSRAVARYHQTHGALPDTPRAVGQEETPGDEDVEPFFRASKAATLLAAGNEALRAALAHLGIRFPKALEISPHDIPPALPAGPAVLKVSDPYIPHKTEASAVRFVEDVTAEALRAFAQEAGRRAGVVVRAVRIEERVSIPDYGEAILATVWDDEFGPVCSFGEGGSLTELRAGVVRWLPSPEFGPDEIRRLISTLPLAPHWFTGYRGRPPLASIERTAALLYEFGLTVWLCGHRGEVFEDLEVNPLILALDGPAALDLLAGAKPRPEEQQPRPDLGLLRRAMREAERIVVVGVSTTDPNNLGRVLYERLLNDFAGEAVAINPNGGEIAGRRVFRSFAEVRDQAGPPDLTVYAVPAKHTASAMRDAWATFGERAGVALIVASGFDETDTGKTGARELREVVRSFGTVPVLGPNTMALYSNTGVPGDVRVDFLPADRMSVPSFPDPADNNLALVVQSGARFVSFLDKATNVGFRWAVLVGNSYQTDVADGAELAADDPDVRSLAVYIEGFKPGGGQRFAEAVGRCTAAGKTVVVQKVGKTRMGADTARSHTASMGGSYNVFVAAMRQAGAVVAETDEEFIDVSMLASLLADRSPAGNRLFVVNSAGYEGVLAADAADAAGLVLPPPSGMVRPEEITERLHRYLRGTIDCDNNPADVGPMTPDVAYAEVTEAALADPLYDMALVAVTPHGNGMIGTLPPYDGEGKIAPLLIDLWRRARKPFAVSINGGPMYAGLAQTLAGAGLPVFPNAERAVRALALWARARLGDDLEQRSST